MNSSSLGVQVFLAENPQKKLFHRKLAIIDESPATKAVVSSHTSLCEDDRKILWEGSLNILSQNHSREIMRRIDGQEFALEMLNFLKLKKFI